MSQAFAIRVDQYAWTKEFKKLEKAFNKLKKESRKDLKEVLVSQARLFCIDLIFVTTPYGKSKKSQKKGQNAVSDDINKIYVTGSDLYDMIKFKSKEQAGAFYHFMKSGSNEDLKRAEGILKSLEIRLDHFKGFDGGRHHREKRNHRGRISNTSSKYYTKDSKAVARYVEEVQKRVGIAKAGWAAGADDLSSYRRGIPAWIRKHTQSENLGSAKISKRGNIDEVIIINKVNYITKLVGRAQIIRALGKRARAIERLVKKVEEINQKKFNRREK